jgi:hypothetical protein
MSTIKLFSIKKLAVILLVIASTNAFSQADSTRSLSRYDNKLNVSVAINLLPSSFPFSRFLAKDINFSYRFSSKVPVGFTFSLGPGIIIQPKKMKISDDLTIQTNHVDFRPGLFVDYPLDAGRYVTFNPRLTAYYPFFFDRSRIESNRYGIDKSKNMFCHYFSPEAELFTEWRWGEMTNLRFFKPFTLEGFIKVPVNGIYKIYERGSLGVNLRYFIL